MAIVSPSAMARERVHKRYDVDDDSSPNLTIVQLCLLIAAIPRWLTCLLLIFIDRRRRRGMIAASTSLCRLNFRCGKHQNLLRCSTPNLCFWVQPAIKRPKEPSKGFQQTCTSINPRIGECSQSHAKMIFVASHESSQELFPMPFPLLNRNGHSEIH